MKITNFSHRWFKKIVLPALGVFSVVTISPLAIIACSNQTNNSGITQNWINQKYETFENALLVNPSKSLFVEYFDQSNLDENGRFEINPEIIQKLFNIDKTENDPAISEKYYGKIENNQLNITYELSSNNNILKPNFDLKPQVVSNLQTLTTEQKTNFQTLEQKWNEYQTSIEIKNGNNSLDKTKYNTIGVNLLKTEQNDETNKFFSDTLNKFKNDNKTQWENNQWTLKFAITFDDIKKNDGSTEGEISIKLDIYNDDYWNLPLIVINSNSATPNHTIKINGFKSNQKHQEEVIALYQPLGKFYDLSEFNQNKPYKQLASSIYDIEQLGILLNNIKTNGGEKLELPEYFDKTKNDPNDATKTLWYKLETEINANDINGTTNIDFTIVDNFTGVKIRPQNVTKIMTLTKFFPLVNNRDNPTDYATMENIFQAYKLFEKINLKDTDKLQTLPSKFITNIDFNFLSTKTDFDKQQEFEITFNDNKPDNDKPKFSQTNRFRIFKINNTAVTTNRQASPPANQPNNDLIKNDDINGIKEIPVLLQIQLDMDTPPDQPNNGANQGQWYTVLPHTKSSTSTGDVFSSKSEEIRYAKIGGFRTKDIDITNKIYDVFTGKPATPAPPSQPPAPAAVKQIELQVKESIFNELINKTQKAAIDLLESQQLMTDKVKELLAQSTDNEIKNDVDNIIKKYSFFFDLAEVPLNAENDNAGNVTKLKTNQIDLKLTAKTNSDKIFENIGADGQPKNFPKVEIIINKTTF